MEMICYVDGLYALREWDVLDTGEHNVLRGRAMGMLERVLHEWYEYVINCADIRNGYKKVLQLICHM